MRNYFSVLLLFSFPAATLAATPLQTDVSAGFTYEDNVNRAFQDPYIKTDRILSVDGNLSYRLPVNNISYFSLKGTLEINHYSEFSRLSNNRVGVEASYHFRPFSGYSATSFKVLAGYQRRYYDSDQRDGSAINLELGLSKRLTDMLTLRAGYIREDIDAEESQGVFDAENNRLYIDLDLKAGQNNTVYATLGYFDGNLVSTAPYVAGTVYDVWVIDDAYLQLGNTPTPWWAYKFTGTANTYRLGDYYAIDSKQGIDGSLFYYDSESDSGTKYTGVIYNISYMYRF